MSVTSREELEAKRQIREILETSIPTNWQLPPELAGIAMSLSRLPADEALQRAEAHIASIQAANERNEERYQKALKELDELEDNPITSASRRGLIGYLTRQILATLNGTPSISLRWFEVMEDGLHMYQPFATVTERMVTHADLAEGRLVLSVNPPGYMDAILGFLRQFRDSVSAPWGEVVVYEPGSGDIVATAVAWRPEGKVRQIRKALENIHLAQNPYVNYQRVPRKVDLLSYYNFEE